MLKFKFALPTRKFLFSENPLPSKFMILNTSRPATATNLLLGDAAKPFDEPDNSNEAAMLKNTKCSMYLYCKTIGDLVTKSWMLLNTKSVLYLANCR